MEKITLLVLTLNEIDGVKVIMPTIDKTLFHEIIFIDGGSTDGTVQYANDNGYTIYEQQNPGLGGAYIDGLTLSTGDIVVLFSPDGNSDVTRLEELIDEIKKGFDIVIVSRYLDWAKSDDDDVITGFGNWMFTKLYNFLYSQSVTDHLVIYRALRKSLFHELNLNHQGIAWTTQLMCRAAKAKKKISEIPGDEPDRIGGKRKMRPIRNGIAELVMLIKEKF